MAHSGEMEISETYLHYFISGMNGEAEENLTFSNEKICKD